ncbi:hypothetical protein DdX_16232 [Ditylenchus destructor]|uniref:Uncharacterized protein n=1 Tax=Ditylenchus destructor TaxID=166010 RepID=A0AAD4MTG5_9BILA|nr:hypothetical protein DdX_16232 [Ditylenchus destructor]
MRVYMMTHICGSTLACGYQVYMLIFWRPPSMAQNQPLYNPYIVFWLSIWQIGYFAITSIPVLFLSLDRCLALKNVAMGKRNRFLLLCAFLIILLFSGSTVILLMEQPLDIAKVRFCETAACLMLKYRNLPQFTSKIIFECLNLLLSFVLFYMCAKVVGHANSNKNHNKIIKFLVSMEILFGVVPTFAGYGFNLITGISAATYAGEFVFLSFAIENACCSIFYSMVVFKKRSPKSTVTAPVISLLGNNSTRL